METVTRFAERQAGSVSAVSTPGPEVARTLSVTASYLLSEDGRKASLLAGGDGHAVQQIALQVPANRLHLVSVDKQGVARLKLRPRFEMDGDRGHRSHRRRAALRRAADDRGTLSGRGEEPRAGERLLRRARRSAIETQRYRPSTSRERRRSVSSRTRNNAPSRIRRRRQSDATSSPTAVACCSTSEPTRDSRRMFRPRRIGASVLICGPGKSAIDRTERRSSRSTMKRSGSSLTGSLPTEPRNREHDRPPACSRWQRRLRQSQT